MYADRVVTESKGSVKDRLNNGAAQGGNFITKSSRQINGGTKRQRQNDDKWKHDLYDDDEEDEDEPQVSNPNGGVRDLRSKLQNKGHGRLYQGLKNSSSRGTQDLREKLSGSMHAQPVNNDVPQPKEVVEVVKRARKSVPLETPAPETKKTNTPAPRKKSQQKAAEPSVDTLLQSLGLEKYSITFQAEEIDMTALMHMNDEDLRILGIPMGPRKKILLALDSRA